MADILTDGAVLTKGPVVVNLELDGDLGLFFMSKTGPIIDTDRAAFDTTQERDEALRNTVDLYLSEGWQMVGGA